MNIIMQLFVDYRNFSKALNEVQMMVAPQVVSLKAICRIRKSLPRKYRSYFDRHMRIAVTGGLSIGEAAGCGVSAVVNKIEETGHCARS